MERVRHGSGLERDRRKVHQRPQANVDRRAHAAVEQEIAVLIQALWRATSMVMFLAIPKPPGNVVMSDVELNRLPPVFKEIVQHQRELEEYCSCEVVDFRTAQNMLDRRAYLARCANRIWFSDPSTMGSA
jgi:hypothetical protein